MATRESTTWKTVSKHLSPFGILERVENRIGTGTPDVHFLLQDHMSGLAKAGWIELKSVALPKRATTPVRFREFTLDQRRWLRRYNKEGGAAFLLSQVGPNYLLHRPGSPAWDNIGELPFDDLCQSAVWGVVGTRWNETHTRMLLHALFS
jgi:hypothetical protein